MIYFLNAKWAICQLYHDENKFHFDDMVNSGVLFVLDQHAELELKQPPVGRHVAPLGHVIMVLATSPLAKKQHIPILFILV
jgi:hypothetical protein